MGAVLRVGVHCVWGPGAGRDGTCREMFNRSITVWVMLAAL